MSVNVRRYRKSAWEVDISVRMPDGVKLRERVVAPVSSKSGALRWVEERLRLLLLQGPPKPTKELPLLKDFKRRYIEGYVRANRLKENGVAAKESMLKNHILPQLGDKRLDKINDECVQKLKGKQRDERILG